MRRNFHKIGLRSWKKKARKYISLVMSSAKKQKVQIQIPNLKFKHPLSVFSNIQFRRTCSYGLICILTLLLVVLGYNPPALTQGAPGTFTCDRTLYISQGDSIQGQINPTTLSSVITTPNFALNNIGTAAYQYNAIGLNVRDGFIYGIAPQSAVGSNQPPTIYRINNAGVATAIGAPQPNGTIVFPVIPDNNPNQSFAFAGDINRNGIYYVYVTNVAAPANNLFAINLATNTMVSSVRLQRADGTSPDFSDIAFNPVDDQLYAFDSFRVNGVSTAPGQMVRIDPTTGALTYFGATQPNVDVVGASFFDAFGNFYVYDINGNVLVTRNVSITNPVAFQLQGNTTAVNRFDGASCAYAPIAEKIVDPPSVPANGIVTYRYRLANQLGQPLSTANLTFSDNLPAGLTYVDQTLNNSAIGGTPNAYGGNSLLQIAGITIPPRGSVEISVNVRVRPIAGPGTVLNQASLNNIPPVPGVNLPPTVISDFPPTGIYPDKTPLQVPPTPLIGLAKRVASVENLGSGNYRVTYEFVVSNAGNVPLSNVQVTEDLSQTFGTTPFQVTGVSSSTGNLTTNSGYNGRTDTNLLAATGNTLAIGESKKIQIVLTVTPGANLGPYNNQAVATAQSPVGPPPPAQSQNGINSDPDRPGSATPLNFGAEKPVLGVAKAVASVVETTGGNLIVTYSIRVQNYGDVVLNQLQLTENLATTFGATPFTINRVSSPTGNLTPNPNYNGRTDFNLLLGTDTLAVGEAKTLELVVTITPPNQRTIFTNQVEGTALSPNGQRVNARSNAGFDATPVAQPAPTQLTVGPNLRLVKRITNATRGGVPIGGVNFASFVDDPNDVNDNATGWSQLPGGFLAGVYRIGSDNLLQSGDEVEYTVYYLSDGSQPVTDVKICDPIPEKTTFIPNAFQPGQGILLNQQAANTSLTNASDADQGTFFDRLTPVTSPPCPNPNNSNGAVLVNLGNLPSTAPNNVGFTRFRVRID